MRRPIPFNSMQLHGVSNGERADNSAGTLRISLAMGCGLGLCQCSMTMQFISIFKSSPLSTWFLVARYRVSRKTIEIFISFSVSRSFNLCSANGIQCFRQTWLHPGLEKLHFRYIATRSSLSTKIPPDLMS